jgi:hypothetical protein
LFAVAFISGCAATKIPKGLTYPEKRDIVASDFPKLIIGVDEPADNSNRIHYENKKVIHGAWVRFNLVNAFRKTGLFERVEYLSELKGDPDLVVADVGMLERERANFFHAALCFVTLGMFPLWGKNDRSFIFILRNPKTGIETQFNFIWKDQIYFGWVGLFLNLSDDWALFYPDKNHYADDPYYEHFTLFLVRQLPTIRKLLRD